NTTLVGGIERHPHFKRASEGADRVHLRLYLPLHLPNILGLEPIIARQVANLDFWMDESTSPRDESLDGAGRLTIFLNVPCDLAGGAGGGRSHLKTVSGSEHPTEDRLNRVCGAKGHASRHLRTLNQSPFVHHDLLILLKIGRRC